MTTEYIPGFTAAELLKRVVRHPPGWNTHTARWVLLAEIFAVGSTRAHEICAVAGYDPDERMPDRRKKTKKTQP